jgi:cardiolipin synthase
MNWLLLYEIAYTIVLILVCLRIIYDTQSTTKTLAYLLLAIFVPFAGMIFYFLFGINYRKRKMYSKKLSENDEMAEQLKARLYRYSKQTYQENDAAIDRNIELAKMLLKETMSPLTGNNAVKLLVNGEQKFPEVLRAMREAKNHIHLEYYIYEDDEIGKAIEQVLVQKAKEGVEVRFIYDDFGSSSIRRKFVRRMRASQIKIFPFFKVYFSVFANRINYRNHRKIIVIDGHTAFVGGINVSDKYINDDRHPKKLYWRDTHLRIDGPGRTIPAISFFV